MASRVSKRKRVSKEFEVLKERWEIEDAVFDKKVLLLLADFMKKGFFEKIDFPLNRGKEANVYRATNSKGDFLAVKIYRIETTRFFKKMDYIIGDPRFTKVKKDRRNLAFSFSSKEYKNLRICEKIGIKSPIPLAQKNNVVLMQYLGDKEGPYPQMYHFDPDQSHLKPIIDQIKLMYQNGLVHSDLSAYNILLGPDGPLIIDLAQGVIKGHPYFEKFLERDVLNVLGYFKKKKELKKTLEYIKS